MDDCQSQTALMRKSGRVLETKMKCVSPDFMKTNVGIERFLLRCKYAGPYLHELARLEAEAKHLESG